MIEISGKNDPNISNIDYVIGSDEIIHDLQLNYGTKNTAFVLKGSLYMVSASNKLYLISSEG